ncbi:MAG: ABC transporter ATP-binding protein [Lachnospiraceae bacterium]|nr:ABC transporter ATP-binding protein [Lachnospiraceae bacterium]
MQKQQNKKDSSLKIVKEVVRYFLPIVWKTRKSYFFSGVIQVVVGAISPFVKILVLPLIIDELLGGRDVQKLISYAAIMVLGDVFLSLIDSIMGVVMEKYAEKFNNYITEEMSRRVMELDFQLTEDKKALDQMEAARTGMDWYSGGVHGIFQQLFNIASAVIAIIGVVVLILMNAPILFILTAIVLVITAILNNKNNKIEIEAYGRLSKLNRVFGYLGWELTDFRYGKDIRLYGAKDMMVEKWQSYNKETLKNWKWQADEHLPLNMIKTAVDVFRNLGTYLYLGILVIVGKISIGIFSQMLSAGNTFTMSMHTLVGTIQEVVKRCNYAYEYVKFMDYPAAIEKGDRPVKEGAHTIEFKNVSFTYPGADVKVLDGVNVTLHPGEHLSVVGLNGAGKTTFVKLLCRLYDPTEGEILLDGVNIKEYDYNEYMALFAPVFQDFKLFAFSIKDNVSLDGNCEEEDMSALLEQVGLKEKISTLEKGAETMLFKAFDEDGIEPSGGEQQKIAIARALYKKAPVVILDEPTAALDPVAEYDIYRQFDTLVGGKTAIYISHRLSSCKFCDRIAVFSEGRIKEYGTHDELVGLEGGVYAEMFAAQAQYYN